MLCGYPPFYGCCGKNCGWENGAACETCQVNILNCFILGSEVIANYTKIVVLNKLNYSVTGSVPHCFQDQLFTNIQEGQYQYPQDEWNEVSKEAEDLISHLLVRDPIQRYSAAQVLRHTWVTMESPKAPLATPRVLHRYVEIVYSQVFCLNNV